MKLKKTITVKNKLTKLKIIETKIYQKNIKNSLKLSDITSRLKKSLNLIYQYHINNKRILFVGVPISLSEQFKQFIGFKHVYMPSSVWLNGIITNQMSCFKYLYKNRGVLTSDFSEILYQLNNKIDLIVILDSQFTKNVINESYFTNTPLVCLGSVLQINDFKVSYKVPGNFKFSKKKIRNDFFSLILLATIKKATGFKKKAKNNSYIYKQRRIH